MATDGDDDDDDDDDDDSTYPFLGRATANSQD